MADDPQSANSNDASRSPQSRPDDAGEADEASVPDAAEDEASPFGPDKTSADGPETQSPFGHQPTGDSPGFSGREGDEADRGAHRSPFGRSEDPSEGPSKGPSGFGSSDLGASGPSATSSPIAALERGNVVLDMARLWIRENQTTAMLGAFAVGVFVGAVSRKS